ncbi:hypothetical protein HDZ31DRAFT_59699 [Schizophyllum fasciatum]
MGRWTQFDEDSHRLPEGFRRISYDSETKRYTFVDAYGVTYVGRPGEEYGAMIPAAELQPPRPGAFADDRSNRPLPSRPKAQSSSSFHDFIPSNRISGAPPPAEEPSSSKQMADVVETVMPKVQGVVQTFRRRFGTTTRREKGKSSPGFASDDSYTKRGSPPPAGDDEKYAYTADARRARPKENASEKSPLLSKSST